MLGKLRKKLNKKGFTLIEMVVVIAIIGILMMLAVPRLTGYTESARETADGQLESLYGNTFNVLLGSGKISNRTGANIVLTIGVDGEFDTTSYNDELLYRAEDGTYPAANVVKLGSHSTEYTDDVITLCRIQDEYISKGGKGGTAVPAFQSRLYQNGIRITIDAQDRVTTERITS